MGEKRERATRAVDRYARIGYAVAVTCVLPGSATAATTTVGLRMCRKIGRIFRGSGWTMAEDRRIAPVDEVAVFILSFQIYPLFPYGWAVRGAVADGAIRALGEAIIRRYELLGERTATAGEPLGPLTRGSIANDGESRSYSQS